MGIPMHWYRLRHDGLVSSSTEKKLHTWVNMSQQHALIANKANFLMSFISGIMVIMVSRLKKIRILPYLVLVKLSLQYWVQFWLSPFKRHGCETEGCSPVGSQDDQGLGHVTCFEGTELI